MQDNEIPLIFCYCMVTSRGIWRKNAFIPWKQAVVTTGKAPLGEDMTIYINEKSIARPAYQRTYYQISPEAEVLYALEKLYERIFYGTGKSGGQPDMKSKRENFMEYIKKLALEVMKCI